MTISIRTENIDSRWWELFVEIRKISTSDTPNQPLLRSKELSDSEYNTFKHFFESQLLLMLQDRVEKERNEVRDLNSQLKCPVNDLGALCVP